MIIYDVYGSFPEDNEEYFANCSISDVYTTLIDLSGFHRANKKKITTLIAWLPNIARINAGNEDVEVIFTNGESVEVENVGIVRDLCDKLLDYTIRKLETFTYSKDSRNKETQEAGKKCNLDITRCLTIATSHITEETDAKLCEPNWCGTMGLSVYDKEDYGYWIWCDIDIETIARLPEDLRACIKLAKENNCDWLCLDCDGCEVDGLPTYVW